MEDKSQNYEFCLSKQKQAEIVSIVERYARENNKFPLVYWKGVNDIKRVYRGRDYGDVRNIIYNHLYKHFINHKYVKLGCSVGEFYDNLDKFFKRILTELYRRKVVVDQD